MKTIYGDEKSSVSLIRGSEGYPSIYKNAIFKNYLNANTTFQCQVLYFMSLTS